MELEQKYCCAICGIHKNDNPYGLLGVDHRHIDGPGLGPLRALLCGDCNIMLGHAKDNPDFLRKGADYIESFA